MSDRTKLGAGPGDKWFAVDAARIMRLPERLRVLWPRELMPGARVARSAVTAPGTPSGVMSGNSAVTATTIRETVMLGEPAEGSSRRGLDVLTAWLAGFTAELNLTRSRITIVISSGVETAHLEVSLCDDICLAILVLHGEGFEEFADFQLLRRLRPQDLAQVTEELCSLVENDCVLTLTCLDESKVAGMEFLHRVEGVWSRPTLEREGEAITVGAEHKLDGNAVRLLLASTMARLQTAVFSRPPMTGIQP